MAILWAIIGGIVGAVAGWVVAAVLSLVIMGLLGVSDFEGGRAMASFWGFGPIGGLVGLILGIWLALRLAGGRMRVGALAKRGVLALLGIAAVIGAAIFIIWQSGDHRLTYDGAGATLEFEIRVPADYALPSDAAMVQVEIDTDKNQQPGYLDKDWLRHEAGYSLLSGGVELYFRTAQRLLVLKLGDHRDRLFKIRLPGKPDPDGDWSDWQKVDFIGLPDQPQTMPPTAADPFEIRYRVRVWGQG
jgi:hypothetical protein